MVAISSPQSPPVDPNYQMEAFLEYVNAAPLPPQLQTQREQHGREELDAGDSEQAGGRIRHLSSDSPGEVPPAAAAVRPGQRTRHRRRCAARLHVHLLQCGFRVRTAQRLS